MEEPCQDCETLATCSRLGCARDHANCVYLGGPCYSRECEGGCRLTICRAPSDYEREFNKAAEAASAEAGYAMHFEKAEHLPTGAIRSDATGKGRFDLFPPLAMRRVAIVYEKGAEQKGDNNWMLGVPRTRLLSSALRHTFQAVNGETDEDHLAHAVWNLLAAIHFEESEGGEQPC